MEVLVAADDYQVFRPVIAPVLVRAHHSAWRKRTEGADLLRFVTPELKHQVQLV